MLYSPPMLWFSCIAIVFRSAMITAPKLAQIRFQVRRYLVNLTFYFIAFIGLLKAIETIEPISAYLVSTIYDFIQHARTGYFTQNSYHKFAKQFFAERYSPFLSQIRHHG